MDKNHKDPDTIDLNASRHGHCQPTYRMLRKKVQIFEKACQARGQLVVTEAALMMLNSLEGDNWLAMEDVSLDRFDTMKAFDEFYKGV